MAMLASTEGTAPSTSSSSSTSSTSTTTTTDGEKPPDLSELDFEISWAMFNYYSAIGDPTRATGVNRNQWRSFCNSCSGLATHISTAEMDLMFAAALKVECNGGRDKRDKRDKKKRGRGSSSHERNIGEEMAMKTASSPRTSFSSSSASPSAANARSTKGVLARTISSSTRNRSELNFVQFFYALHQASEKVPVPPLFVEDYLFPLASTLMHKLVTTSGTRRKSVKLLLKPTMQGTTGALSSVKKIIKSNRKTFRRLYGFYLHNNSDHDNHSKGHRHGAHTSKEFDFNSLLAFAKDFDIVPTMISHSVLQKIMHDVKMNSDEDSANSGEDEEDVREEGHFSSERSPGHGGQRNRTSTSGTTDGLPSCHSRNGSTASTASNASNASTNSIDSIGSTTSTGSTGNMGSNRFKKRKKVSQSELSLLEFEEVLVGISQSHRYAQNNHGETTPNTGTTEPKVLKPTLSYSTFLDKDLIKLINHLEYGEGRKKMAHRGEREHRVSRFTSSEHFTIPKF